MSLKYTHGKPSMTWALKCTDLPQFDALLASADTFRSDDKLHLRNLCSDAARCAGLTALHQSRQRKVILDYSRQRVTGETMELLYDLADAVGLTDGMKAMRSGQSINATEDRPVLHHILRVPADYTIELRNIPQTIPKPRLMPRANSKTSGVSMPSTEQDASFLIREVHDMQDRIRNFVGLVRSGAYTGSTGKPLLNVLVITSGCQVQSLAAALEGDAEAVEAIEGRTLRFLTNVDPNEFIVATKDLDPEETLVVILSKTFTENETMLLARTVKTWLSENLDGNITRHLVAVTANPTRCAHFGVAKDNVFRIFEWVNMRFAICSAFGLLPLALQYSFPVVAQLIEGAHDMDEHFFESPLRDNIPVILGLLGVWNSTFLGYGCRALLPYSHAMRYFPDYVQQLDMESNGKRVALDGTALLHRSGEVDFGGAGTTCQATFFQLMHQGRSVPSDFVGFMESSMDIDVPGEAVSNHDELMSHFFSQPDALAYGKALVDLVQEGAPEPLREHMVFPGNRPSSSILLTKLDAFAIGQLMALYEHRTAVQGFVWGINSFDQFGSELGKSFVKTVRAQLSASRKTGASVQGFNYSTSSLLEHYLAQGRQEMNERNFSEE